jgi:hypothetical protein
MADWKNLIGDGNGVFCCFSPDQVNEEGYNEAYLALLNNVSEEEYASMVTQVAQRQGIYENSAANKFGFFKKIQKCVVRVGLLEEDYIFKYNFYYNSTLDQGQVLGYIKAGNMNGFLTHPDTQQLTYETGQVFLDFLL